MDTSLCVYKYMFGKPNTGAHKYRILNIAIVDVTLTIIAGYAIAKYYNQDFTEVLICLFLLGIICHRIFCVRTTVDKFLFN